MTKKIRIIALFTSVVVMFAATASAVTISVNGTTAYDSGGLEGLAPNTYPLGSYLTHAGTGANVELLSSGGPGSYAGSSYLLLEKEAVVDNAELSARLLMDAAATTGDQISANLAFYMDSTKTELIDAWDLGPFFSLTTSATGGLAESKTWMGFVPQSTYYTTGGTNPTFVNWAGAAADDMAMVYYDGSAYHQVQTTTGDSIFAGFDEWNVLGLDYTVGGTYTVTVNGVTSSAMVSSTTITNDVIGLHTFVNGNTAAAGYYLEPLSNTMSINGKTAFDTNTLQGNQIIPVFGSNSFVTTPNSNIGVLGLGSAGPGAYEGSDYLVLEKDANTINDDLHSHMLLSTPATNGDQISADLAFYMDSTKTELTDTWDFCAFFSFVTGEVSGVDRARTWLGFVSQSPYYTEGGTNESLIDWTGAEADDMAMVYYDGSAYHQVQTAEGVSIFTSFDEWHEIGLDYTVGGTYTVTVDDVTSDALVTNNSANTDDIIGLRTFAGGNTAAAGFYLDSIASEQAPIAGDANKDGKVDGSDVTILAGNWQVGVDGMVEATWAMGDFNGDKKVDGSDVTILAGNWQAGVTAAAAAVPEPSALVMLLALAGAFLVWRRR